MRCCRYADTEDDCTHCAQRIRHDPYKEWVHITGPQAGGMKCAADDMLYAHPASQPCPLRCRSSKFHTFDRGRLS